MLQTFVARNIELYTIWANNGHKSLLTCKDERFSSFDFVHDESVITIDKWLSNYYILQKLKHCYIGTPTPNHLVTGQKNGM